MLLCGQRMSTAPEWKQTSFSIAITLPERHIDSQTAIHSVRPMELFLPSMCQIKGRVGVIKCLWHSSSNICVTHIKMFAMARILN